MMFAFVRNIMLANRRNVDAQKSSPAAIVSASEKPPAKADLHRLAQ
jgi:hypothetical protein